MNNIRVKFSIEVALLFVGFIACIFYLGGCSESNASKPESDLILDRADQQFQKEADRPPTAKTLYAMADILATQGRDAKSEFVLKRTTRAYPDFVPAYNSLAQLQMRQGRIDEAFETISAGLRIRPDDPVLLNNLGICFIITRDYESALEMFTRAAGAMSENARYRANMAVALGLMGRDEESMSLFRQVLPQDQANHNLNVLREARTTLSAASPAHLGSADQNQ